MSSLRHLVLIPAVELQRQVTFGLHIAALIGAVVTAIGAFGSGGWAP